MHILYGTEPSFFTRKSWASLRLLGLEVDDRLKSLAVKAEVEAAAGGYSRFPVVQCPDGAWLVDSSAIGVALSARHPAQALLPADPALEVLLLLADDWLDEWFLRVCIAWRPIDPESRAWAAGHGARNLFGLRGADALPPELEGAVAKATAAVERFFERSGQVNAVVPETRAEVRALADASLGALDAMLAASPFLAGTRPSLADCALWGFLDAGLLWEPGPRAHLAPRYPALLAFHARLRALADAGGLPLGDWDPLDVVAARLAPLLAGDALGFAPFLQANRAALASGAATLQLDGVEVPARGFTEKSRVALGQKVAALAPEARARFDASVGGWPLVAVYLS
jgi:glutathione S-transferase